MGIAMPAGVAVRPECPSTGRGQNTSAAPRKRQNGSGFTRRSPPAIPIAPLHSDSRITEKVYAPLAPEDLRGFAESTEEARVLSFNKRKKKAAKK